MNKIVAVNFSCSPKSMQQRGIKLLNKFIPFHKIVNLGDFNIPILGGNVSMYNSTNNKDISPSVVIVMIGLNN